ncbi:Protein cereblon [Aphelenchoides bicaudatus]|nr:Protein cereblon [Aphelenchoides bicaudatus]
MKLYCHPLNVIFACNFNRLPTKEKKKCLQSVFAIDSRILTYCSTAHAIQVLRKWLCVFIAENKFENAMERGLPLFSFWVAANLPISSKEKLDILIENSVDKRLKMEVDFVLKRSKLACNCGSEKFDVNDLINLSSESLGNCYVNPHGYVHDMFTSRKIQNVAYHGNAETKFSWFAGYSWTIMNCSNCGCHMGWKFKSSKLEPRKFFGINRSAIQPTIEQSIGFDILT